MRVQNKHTAQLGLPGPVVGLGGVELAPGDNDIPDALWAEAMKSPQVKAWVDSGLIVLADPAPAKKPRA